MSETPTPTPAPAPVLPTLARNIHVSRQNGGGEFDLSIDGKPFPWYLAGDAGAKVEMSTDRVPAVTITILAETVTVDDQLMSGQGVRLCDHDHSDDEAAQS